MKIRKDFVSNSSSSSFIVIGDGNFHDNNFYGERHVLPDQELGHTKFGWEFEEYSSFWDKLNWCAIHLQILECANHYHTYQINEDDLKCDREYKTKALNLIARRGEFLDLLKKVCMEKFNLDVDVAPFDNLYNSYIDHQSGIIEDWNCAKMFESADSLYKFLASSDSYIRTGNDNAYPEEIPSNWYDKR